MVLRDTTSVLLLSVAMLLGCSSEAPQFPETKPQGPSPSAPNEDPLEKSLRKAVDELLDALRMGRSDLFLDICARGGMSIDVDGIQSYDDIRRDFKARKGWYCHYFDTACLQKDVLEFRREIGRKTDGGPPLPVSYRELPNTVTGLEVLQGPIMRSQDGKVFGAVTVKWKSPPPKELCRGNYLELSFVLEDNEWRLVGDELLGI